jgi:formylglycine-generating enzyme required for sulfatase activity
MHTFRLLVRDQEDSVVSQGTAWFLPSGRLVTAFHVVGSLDAPGWLHEAGPGHRYELELPATAAKRLSLGRRKTSLALTPLFFDADADLAVLDPEAEIPAELGLPMALLDARADSSWSGRGFPAFRQPKAFSLSGRVTSLDLDASPREALQVLVDQGTQVDWSGVSGSPVLVDGRVAAVITQMTDNTNSGFASPLDRLRHLDWFADLAAGAVREWTGRSDPLPTAVAEAIEGLRGTLRGATDDAARELLRCLDRGPGPTGARVLIIGSREELAEHRHRIAERVGKLPGVGIAEEVDPADPPRGSAIQDADLRVVLLGWTATGEAALRQALACEPSVVLALRLQMDPDDADDAEYLRAKRLRKEATVTRERKFQTPEEAIEIALAPVAEWVEDITRGSRLLPAPWELEYLRKRRPVWETGELERLHLRAGDHPPKRASVHVSLRAEPDIAWQDEDGALVLVGEEPEGDVASPDEEQAEGPGREGAGHRGNPWIEQVLSGLALHQFVVEGEAGAGKTVLVQHLAQVLAEVHLGTEPPPHHLDLRELSASAPISPIPMLIRASTLATAMDRCEQDEGCPPGPPALVCALVAECEAAGAQAPPGELLQGLGTGRYQVLIDSLDEVSCSSGRTRVLKLVHAVAESLPACRLLLTTRPTPDTGRIPVCEPLRRVRLAPLDAEGQKALVHNWVKSRGQDETYETALATALAELRSRPTGRDLDLGNPLLLTATVLVYETGRQQLPDNAADLYGCIVDSLCRTRNHCLLDPDVKRQLLERLFLGAQVHGGTAWPVDDAVAWLRPQWTAFGDDEAARDGLSNLANDTGLFRFDVAPGHDGRPVPVLRPAHRGFQEYLAACGWARGGDLAGRTVEAQTAALFSPVPGRAPPIEDPEWRRVLDFLPGVYGSRDRPTAELHLDLLWNRAMGQTDAPALEDPAGLHCHVARALVEYHTHFENHRLLTEVPGVVLALFRAEGASWSQDRRLEVLEALGALGDPRSLEDPWVPVPGGEFTMGGDAEGWSAAPAHLRAVRGFAICWRPVTVADFEPFVGAGGYTEDRWWTDAAEEIRADRPWTQPAGWRRQLHHRSRPVHGVCWWEARAFCAWTNERDRERWRLIDGQAVDLPSEGEWEFVARGGSARHYPWGDDEPVQGIAAQAAWGAYRGAGPGSPTPVGAFPAGSTGRVVDLAGNVWEWCLDPWRSPSDEWPVDTAAPFVDGAARSVDIATALVDKTDDPVDKRGRPRVVRGGSWFDNARNLRCAARGRSEPRNRYDNLGFRLVRRLFREHVD